VWFLVGFWYTRESENPLLVLLRRGYGEVMKRAPAFSSRRPSKLGDALDRKKLDEARRLTPQQRLQLALHLSDAAATLRLACSPKR
jgi:hypothetical protein